LADTNFGLLANSGGTLTGALLLDDAANTAAAPALAFDGDSNTGIYRSAADALNVASGGVENVEFGASEVVFNDTGADIDFRIEGDTNPNLFAIDAGTDEVRVANLNGGPLGGFRNRIINGNMLYTQRYGAGPFPIFGVGAAYILDRWKGSATIASNFRLSRIADAPSEFTYSQRADAVTGATISASTFFVLQQFIEGYNVADLAFGTASAATVTLSFWVKSSITGTHSGALRNNGTTRSYPFTYTISVANTWEKKAITIPGDTTGTWLKEGGIGIEVIFDLGSGSSNRGTAGAWVASGALGVTGAATPMATAGATWFITGVQFEKGTVATPFEHLLIETQTYLIQRYYAVLGNADTLPVTAFTDQARGFFKLPVSMRANPTCTFSYDIGGGATFAINPNGGYQASASSNVSGFSVRADAEI
jgi:hypothetical protein